MSAAAARCVAGRLAPPTGQPFEVVAEAELRSAVGVPRTAAPRATARHQTAGCAPRTWRTLLSVRLGGPGDAGCDAVPVDPFGDIGWQQSVLKSGHSERDRGWTGRP